MPDPSDPKHHANLRPLLDVLRYLFLVAGIVHTLLVVVIFFQAEEPDVVEHIEQLMPGMLMILAYVGITYLKAVKFPDSVEDPPGPDGR